MEKFEKREMIDRRRKKKEQESAEAISGLKSPCSNFSTRKKFCVCVIYLELDTKIMSLFSDCRRFVGRVTNLQQPQWVSSRIIALFSRALSSVNLTHSISDEEYVCWVKTRPKFCESWYHSIRGRSFEVPFGQLNIPSNLPKNIIAN